MGSFPERLAGVLQQRRRDGLYRQRLTLDGPQGPNVAMDGRQYLNFCSNDYLGLANHPQVVAALQQAAAQYGAGSGASHLVCGHSAPHHELEEALAEFTGRPRALLFSSGYQANTGILTALLQRGDHVFEDRLNHASLLDGGLHSGARFRRFAHNDTVALAAQLAAAGGMNEDMNRAMNGALKESPKEPLKMVVVDGVFSMDGDSAPLAKLAPLCARENAWLMVDDAHGFGVLGDTGAGSVEAAGLGAGDVPVLMATLGKALGTAGAFVAGSEDLIEALIQQARSYIYTTALPPAVAAATLAALAIVRSAEGADRREHLLTLIGRFRKGAGELGLPLMDSASAIQPLLAGEPERALALSAALRERGLLVGAIRPPTVPAGTSRLRITLSAAHTADDVDSLLEALAECWGTNP